MTRLTAELASMPALMKRHVHLVCVVMAIPKLFILNQVSRKNASIQYKLFLLLELRSVSNIDI